MIIAVLSLLASAAPVVAAPLAPYPPVRPVPPPSRRADPPSPCAETCITPAEAKQWAGQVAPKAAIVGTFAFNVAAGIARGERYYLYSEPNLYNCDCLVVIVPAKKLLGTAAGEAANQKWVHQIGHWLVVTGTAHRVEREVLNVDKPTGNYYHPIEIEVDHLDQVKFW
jgi:hypothetical protein